MTLLVTGGAGFIGSNLVDALLDRNEKVLIIDDLSTGRRENLESALERGAELVVEDICNAEAVRALFEKHPVATVFHLAAQIDVRRAVAEPGFDARINVEGTASVLDAAAKNGSPRFVFTSTGGALYGEGAGRALPFSEDADVLPAAPYGQSKLAAESYVSFFARERGLSAITLRLANVYGPRQDPLGEAGVIAIFCGRLANGEQPIVFGGDQTRDFVMVEDVVAALLTAAETDATGAYNIGTGVETSVHELIDILGGLTGEVIEAQLSDQREGEVQRIAIDSTKAADELGWRAKIGLEEGLRRTWDAVAGPHRRGGG